MLALQFAMNRRPIRFGEAAVTLLLADLGKKLSFRPSNAASGSSAGSGQLGPPAASRFSVSRTVDGATPTDERSPCRKPRPPSTEAHRAHGASRSSLLASSPPAAKPKERTLSGSERDAVPRIYPGEINSEGRARSNDQIGMAGEIIAGSRATSPGIRMPLSKA
jgi:hypothetical protein